VSSVVLDTNVLLRLASPAAPEHVMCRTAITALAGAGVQLALVPQVLLEFWVVATRPASVNGFGWTTEQTHLAIDGFTQQMALLPETPAGFERWRGLVSSLSIARKRAHDMRIAAVMLSNGVQQILTLNPADFAGIPDLQVCHP
jgi:predicted nucleic acid-binding protein